MGNLLSVAAEWMRRGALPASFQGVPAFILGAFSARRGTLPSAAGLCPRPTLGFAARLEQRRGVWCRKQELHCVS